MRHIIAVMALAALSAGCGADAPEPAPAGDPAADTGTPVASPDTSPGAAVPDTSSGPVPPVAGGETAAAPWGMPPYGGGVVEATGVATMTAVRVARHEGYDRIVFEFDRPIPAWEVRYVEDPRQCGSGNAVDPGGAAALEVEFQPASAHTEEGRPTIAERTRRPGLPAIRTARLICDFEAIVSWILGVDRRAEVRTMELDSPARLVVDVRHR